MLVEFETPDGAPIFLSQEYVESVRPATAAALATLPAGFDPTTWSTVVMRTHDTVLVRGQVREVAGRLEAGRRLGVLESR